MESWHPGFNRQNDKEKRVNFQSIGIPVDMKILIDFEFLHEGVKQRNRKGI